MTEITAWERKVIRYAATGAHDLGDTDRLWDTVSDLKKRGLLEEHEVAATTYVVPTPEALVLAWAWKGECDQ